MAEYIERKTLLDRIRGTGYAEQVKDNLLAVAATIPAADVRPVVFCKDCLHSVKGEESLECEKHRYVWNNLNRWVNDDDFCSWGVKREES